MSYTDLKSGTTPVDIAFIKPGVPYQDPVTYEMVYPAGTTINTTGNFIHLSPSEIVARQQNQDDSKYKLVIEDTTLNRTITNVFTATIDSVVYEIIGKPKHPQFSNAWLTVYINEK
jgi:hypothetical protein